jgi:RNA recognition motif-containing protein
VNIYVGNLPRQATEDDVRKAFLAFGQVASVAVIKDRETRASRGFGFVEMPLQEEAQAAISGLNGRELLGRALSVNEARSRSEGGGGESRRGGGGRSGRERRSW